MMKLSDAIRRGASRTDKAIGEYYIPPNAYCVIGCALLATGWSEIDGDAYREALREFPELVREYVHPRTARIEPLIDILIDLNDRFGWDRESIADFVDDAVYSS